MLDRRTQNQLGLDGRKRELLLLRRQERDPDKREKVAFRLPTGGGIGEDIKDFFALADGDEEERFGMPVSEFWPPLFPLSGVSGSNGVSSYPVLPVFFFCFFPFGGGLNRDDTLGSWRAGFDI